MKACLMKVNYSPAYTAPHKVGPFDNYKGRLNHAKDIYGNSEKKLRQNLEEAAAQKRTKLKAVLRENGLGEKEKVPIPESSSTSSPSHSRRSNLTSEAVAKRVLSRNGGLKDEATEKKSKSPPNHFDQHKEGVAKAHHSIRLQPLKHSSTSYNISPPAGLGLGTSSYNDTKYRMFSADSKSPYAQKLHRSVTQPLTSQSQYLKFSRAKSSTGSQSQAEGIPGQYQRSKSVLPANSNPTNEPVRINIYRPPGLSKLEKRARREADRAVRDKKVFTILGPYNSLRNALRRRGWVERFADAPPPSEILTSLRLRKPIEESPEKDVDDDEQGVTRTKPWEEENGLYGMMSHALRNATPAFVFSIKTVDVDTRVTKSNQLVNHFNKARSFTTKTGLCSNIRNTMWFETADHNTFYPRCYKFDDPIEKEAFIDDYKLSACFGFLKCFVEKYQYVLDKRKQSDLPESEPIIVKPAEEYQKEKEQKEAKEKESQNNKENKENAKTEEQHKAPGLPKSRKISLLSDLSAIDIDTREAESSADSMAFARESNILRGGPSVPVRAYEMAKQQTAAFLRFRNNDDLDMLSARENQFTSSQWESFIHWYYQFTHDGGEVTTVTDHMVKNAQEMLLQVKDNWPQYELDGYNNVWILKPGAMSRGRGISCERKLDVILGSVEEEDDTMVVQKYIERPFLVYNTKFDIRQWFMITDWNPLTIWFYKDCYLRFCTQEFTLSDFHESIHLSNNSIQKNYSVNEKRSQQLPDDNMWTSEEFDIFLRQNGKGNMWHDIVVEGMKNSITCVMLCTQEYIEPRKSAFELYGADFMLTEDMSPWLIEINSSPSMARNTRATCKLVDSVLEDTLKVVLDRRDDKNCDTGRFELIYKQGPINDPPAVDHTLAIVGKKVVKGKQSKTNAAAT